MNESDQQQSEHFEAVGLIEFILVLYGYPRRSFYLPRKAIQQIGLIPDIAYSPQAIWANKVIEHQIMPACDSSSEKVDLIHLSITVMTPNFESVLYQRILQMQFYYTLDTDSNVIHNNRVLIIHPDLLHGANLMITFHTQVDIANAPTTQAPNEDRVDQLPSILSQNLEELLDYINEQPRQAEPTFPVLSGHDTEIILSSLTLSPNSSPSTQNYMTKEEFDHLDVSFVL